LNIFYTIIWINRRFFRLKPIFLLFFYLISFIFPLFCVQGQDSYELSLDEAINLSLEYNLSLKKTEIDLASSAYSEKNLWSALFPTISASASVGYRSHLLSDITLPNEGPNYSLGLGLRLGLNAGIPYAMDIIRLAHQDKLLEYEDAKNQLSIQITKMFYSLVADNENLVLLEEIFNLAQRQSTRSEVSFRNGLVGELTLTQSRLAAEDARYNLSSAKITYESNMAEFLAVLGMSIDEKKITLLDEVNIIKIEADSEALINQYLYKRPDIVKKTHDIKRLEAASSRDTLSTRAPSLDLSVNWGSSVFDPFSDSLSATAQVSIPIDPWISGTKQAQSILNTLNEIKKAKLDLEMTEKSAKTQIRSLSVLLKNSWNSILIARLSLEAAQRSHQLTEQGFNNGTVELLTLQDARNNMAGAQQRLLRTELLYFDRILDLSSALNIDWNTLIQTYGVPSEEI
jgi:outer membrane protein